MTLVTNHTGLMSGESWSGFGISARPAFITYSFEAAPQPYLSEAGYFPEEIASFQAFTPGLEALAREALRQWADASGITFLETAAGLGDIRFGRHDFSFTPDLSDSAAYAWYPFVSIDADAPFDDAIGGDVFVATDVDASLGLLLHEVGHAIGLKHPFEDEPQLTPPLDSTVNTVMSYWGYDPDRLGYLDIDAVQAIYGTPDLDGSQVAAWSWDAATATLAQTGFDTADAIRGVASSDAMSGGAGDDFLFGGAGDDFLFGGGFAGDGSMQAGSGDDTIDGGDDADGLWGQDGDDVLRAGRGSDAVVGGSGGDSLDGGDGDDLVFGAEFALDGSVESGSGDDLIEGGDGSDGLWGFDGADLVFGGSGDDIALGGDGRDDIRGEAGNDSLLGEDGDDEMSGGSGFDYLWGGAGADAFVFRPEDSYDWVLDFSPEDGDRLRLDAGFGIASFDDFAALLQDFSADGVAITVFDVPATIDRLTIVGLAPGDWTEAMLAIV